MVDILAKTNTHRKAIAQAIVHVSSQETIYAILNKQVPKGDVFEMSKTAGFFAVKKTSDVIPDCHPLPIEYTKITHTVKGLEITILVEVHTIYKTGVEVEAMYGASVTAMTMYDMLKPIDKGITINHIGLIEKSGGKSDFRKDSGEGKRSAVLVVSDAIASGKKDDTGGQYILSILNKNKLENISYDLLPDKEDILIQKVKELAGKTDLLIISGGTGLTKTDKTPEILRNLIDTEIPGIMEYARNYGQNRSPYSMFSRGFAGLIGSTLVLAIPGSSNGARETMDALFPYVLHSFKMLQTKK